MSFDNDIALLRLDRSVKFGPKVQPACLPDVQNSDYDGAMSLVVGWGRIGEAEPTSTVLRSLVMPVWSREQCRQSEYGENRLTNNMICAGFHDGQRDACKVTYYHYFKNVCILFKKKLNQRATAVDRCTSRVTPAAWRSSV